MSVLFWTRSRLLLFISFITNKIIVSVGLRQRPSGGNSAVREGDRCLRLLVLRDFVATLVF
jgi:hypothetical protein